VFDLAFTGRRPARPADAARMFYHAPAAEMVLGFDARHRHPIEVPSLDDALPQVRCCGAASWRHS